MIDSDNRLSIIEEKLALQLKKSKSSFRITLIVYLILIVFVIVYTGYVTNKFKDLATPSTVAELLIMRAEQTIPEITYYLNDNADALAQSFAIQTVDYTRSMIPSLGVLVKGQFDVLIAAINFEFNTKYLPIIDEYFKLHKTEIITSINTLSDEKAAESLANDLMDQVDFSLLNINEEFSAAILKFKQEVNFLAYTPNNQLTKKELAHKRAIAYWMYLIKHAETGKLSLK